MWMSKRMPKKLIGVFMLAAVAITGCGLGDPDTVYPSSANRSRTGDSYNPGQSAFGQSGLDLLNLGGDEDGGGGGGGGIGVNAFLWRASLDTIAFMPLASADPFGGVIITDWYSPPESPDERFKVNLFILDQRLRADGLRASVFRQRRGAQDWQDVSAGPDTATELENAILTRARQLRIDSASR